MNRESSTKTKRYIMTEDLYHLMTEWRQDEHPDWDTFDEAFFHDLSSKLQEDLQRLAFSKMIMIGDEPFKIQVVRKRREDENDLCRKDSEKDSFWIGLDRVYVRGADRYLDITRMFYHDGERIGIGLRPEIPLVDHEYKSIDTRICEIRDAYRRAHCPPEVILADDGTYTGSTVKYVVESLLTEHINIRITEIRLAFATGEGQRALQAFCETGVATPVRYKIHDMQSKIGVHDWVCERDFFLGAPRSGRTLGKNEGKGTDPVPLHPAVSHPYIHGFGDVLHGASITTGRYELGACLIKSSIELWQHIEKSARRPILVSDLPRFPGPGGEIAAASFSKVRAIDYFEKIREIVYGDTSSE